MLYETPLVHVGAVAVALFTTVTEWALAIGPWFERTRKYVLLLGVVFHLGLLCFLALWPLSAYVILSYIAFIPPQRVHDFVDTMLGHEPPPDLETARVP